MIEALDITAEEKKRIRALAKRLDLGEPSSSRQTRYPRVALDEEGKKAMARHLIREYRRRRAEKQT